MPSSDTIDFSDYQLNAVVNPDPYFVIHAFSSQRLPHDLRKPGSVQRWEREARLDRGISNPVWLEVLREDVSTPRMRAVKTIRKGNMMMDKRELVAMTEFSRRKFAHSENFVKFIGWFEDLENTYIAMEYFPHGTLTRYIKQGIPEREVRIITGQLLDGLAMMHEHNYAHRDLKPDNIFIQAPGPGWSVKIGDFGISKHARREVTALRTVAGTPLYKAPEIDGDVELDDGEDEEEYTSMVDLWSLGCVVYEMVAAAHPFPAWPLDFKRLCRGTWYPNKPGRLSVAGWDFVTKLLVARPAGRMTASQALGHKWIVTGGFGERGMPGAGYPLKTPATEPDDGQFQRTVTALRPARVPMPNYQSPISTTRTEGGREKPPETLANTPAAETRTRKSDTSRERGAITSHKDHLGEMFTPRELQGRWLTDSDDPLLPERAKNQTVIRRPNDSNPVKNIAATTSSHQSSAPSVMDKELINVQESVADNAESQYRAMLFPGLVRGRVRD
ncbi:kinase-like domain-containing protein [Aspergillus pseudoustus]|uniref:Serine/threonine-protein kinase ATG1 n=1 Tax=Aspergillus pseudoustus TaxID=1810923 RepID=A0ABR4J460_9EURO